MNRASRTPKRRKEPEGSPWRRYRGSPAVPGGLAAARVGLPSNRTSAHFGGRANYRVWATSTGPRACSGPRRSRPGPPGGSGAREAAGAGVRARRARAAPPQSGAVRCQGRRPGPRRPGAGRRPRRRAIFMPPGCAHAPMPDARAPRRAQATPVLWGEASGCDGLGCELGFGFGEGAGSVPGLDAGSPFPCMASILEKQIAEAEQLFPAPECAPAASACPLPAANCWSLGSQPGRCRAGALHHNGCRPHSWPPLAPGQRYATRREAPHILTDFVKICVKARVLLKMARVVSRDLTRGPALLCCRASSGHKRGARRAPQGPVAAGLRGARQPQLHRPDGAGRAGRVRPGAGRARHAGGRGRAGGAPGRARALRHAPRGRARCGPASAPARPPARQPALSCKHRAGTRALPGGFFSSSFVYTETCPSLPPCEVQADRRAAPLRVQAPGSVARRHAARLSWPGSVAHHRAQEPRAVTLTSAPRAASDDVRLPGAPPRAAAVRLGLAFNGAAAVRERCGPLLASAAWRGCARSAWCGAGPSRQGLSAGVAPVCLRAGPTCLGCQRTARTVCASVCRVRVRARRPSGRGGAQVPPRQ